MSHQLVLVPELGLFVFLNCAGLESLQTQFVMEAPLGGKDMILRKIRLHWLSCHGGLWSVFTTDSVFKFFVICFNNSAWTLGRI